jgi:TPR repeat protein
VAQKAKEGQVFCKYMIANSYYYGDVIELLHIPRGEITDSKIREFQYEAARLYEECIKSGLGFGVHNLEDIYTSGDYGIPKNPKKMLEIKKLGAEHNIREYVRMMGEEYLDKDVDKAEEYFLRAAEKYDYDSYYYLTKLYTYGGKRPLDLRKAKDYAEAGLAIYEYSQGCNNLLGEICFYGGDGVPQDYSKAVKCFEKVLEENNWGAAMLGTCYLKGLGTEKNVEKARNLFLGRENDKLSILGLGEIYCFGLGVEQDIKKGMGYLNQLPSHPRTREIKSHFKRGLFGWKERT